MPAPKSLPGLPADYTPTLFLGDHITKVTDPDFRGKVLRCWATEEDDYPEDHPRKELDRPLLRGEVGISKTNILQIVPESTLKLRQRDFMIGDIVKRSLMNVESGVVTGTSHDVRLTKLITGEILPNWVPFDKLKSSLILDLKDKVVYDEWLGSVDDLVEEAVVECQDGSSYSFLLGGGTLGPGKIVQDCLNKHNPPFLSQYTLPILPPKAQPEKDIIIEVRPVILQITWHVINQMLPISEQDKHPEPQAIWEGEDIRKLTHVENLFAHPPIQESTAKFRNVEDEKEYGFEPSVHFGGEITLRALKIVDTRSKIRVRWQDGTETEEASFGLVPHQNLDDYETWPGDHVMWRGDVGESKVAIIQSVNPHQRVADIYVPDSQEKQTVSVLELNIGDQGRAPYGVNLGLRVLLCNDNLATPPEVSPIGRFETPMANMMSRDALAQRTVVRAGLKPKNNDPSIPESYLPMGDVSKIDWCGDVVALDMDGKIAVQCANGETKKVTTKELQILGDPAMLEMGDMQPDPMGMMISEEMSLFSMMANPNPFMMDEDIYSEASWETMSGQEDDDGKGGWEEDEDEEEMAGGETADEQDEIGVFHMEIDEDEQERLDVEKAVVPPMSPRSPIVRMADLDQPEAGPSSPRINKPDANGTGGNGHTDHEDDDQWKRFEMLEEAPADHHFIGEFSNKAGSRAYHSRLAKEHKALMSSLPENILVRTYENRTDLMRCLIIGPEGTPYANAPFVFDVYLNPTTFPHEPPVVHFHSHTFGKGRCNPNLYEEGKVCLSVLGTWSGDKSESWNPSKSSLLQVFVSISGLVLVRSPYHCEPAFAKLEGTKEGRINSRLYSEKAYVLSRSFVRTALERPPTGLENEIRYLYYDKGRLNTVLEHAQRLITKGEESASDGPTGEDEGEEMWNADAMGSLTMGAILTLKRTISVLEKLAQQH